MITSDVIMNSGNDVQRLKSITKSGNIDFQSQQVMIRGNKLQKREPMQDYALNQSSTDQKKMRQMSKMNQDLIMTTNSEDSKPTQ